jgi:hypothetical protein
MYDKWHASYTPSSHPSHISCAPPDGNRPPPFIRGALCRGHRRIFTAAVQLGMGHCFSSTYSAQFRLGASDNMACR